MTDRDLLYRDRNLMVFIVAFLYYYMCIIIQAKSRK